MMSYSELHIVVVMIDRNQISIYRHFYKRQMFDIMRTIVYMS